MDGRAIEPRREGSKKTASKKAPRVYLHVRSGRPVENRTTPLHPVPRTGNGCRRECAAARSRVVVVLPFSHEVTRCTRCNGCCLDERED